MNITKKTDQEKAIKGLEEVKRFIKCENLPAHSLKALLIIDDAVAQLKAQEPRVMSLDEACNSDCVWYDWRTRGVRPAKITRSPYKNGVYRVQRIGDIDEWVHADEYNEYWRCWTSRPTDEQREATPWN